MSKPILCVDFDGVIHSYTSKWVNEWTIPDPPVPGALAWLLDATKVFTVTVYSSRSKSEKGRVAVRDYIETNAADEFMQWEQVQQLMTALVFASEKIPAFLTVDDRAICFTGDWSVLDPAELIKFKPWNRK